MFTLTYLAKDRIVLGVELSLGILNLLLLLLMLLLLFLLLLGKCTAPKLLLFSSVRLLHAFAFVVVTAVGAAAATRSSPVGVTSIPSVSGIVVVVVVVAPVVGVLPVVGVVLMGRDPSLRMLLLDMQKFDLISVMLTFLI